MHIDLGCIYYTDITVGTKFDCSVDVPIAILTVVTVWISIFVVSYVCKTASDIYIRHLKTEKTTEISDRNPILHQEWTND